MIQNEELSFNVSARTARLIGRENVASAEGAIIELVKNTYDADSDFCVIYFDMPYIESPTSLSNNEFLLINSKAQRHGILLTDFYSIKNNIWYKNNSNIIKNNINFNEKQLDRLFCSFTNIYIIDNGHGMNSEIIKKHWMTIGTDNKVDDYLSNKKRTKSGAKGIGRFALDRLGETCQLWSKKDDNLGIIWSVDWEIFSQKNKTINDIKATIHYDDFNLKEIVKNVLLPKQWDTLSNALLNREKSINLNDNEYFSHGSVIKASYIRDNWDDSLLTKLKDSLETLVPPSEDDSFQIFLFNNKKESLDGLLSPSVCDNYDYKLDINARGDEFHIQLHRNEFDIDKIPLECIKKYFPNGLNTSISFIRKLGQILPGISDANSDISSIGDFSFSLYFLKKLASKKEDQKKYYQKNHDFSNRSNWLDNNSGIKIFRDYFRVRPYGEINNSSWDWLGLGDRYAKNPAQVSRKGQWKVTPHNISGIINISRLNNGFLVDKSSREGLQENDTFLIFKELIIALIKIFEDDRSDIYSKLDSFFRDNSKTPKENDLSNKEQKKAEYLANQLYNTYKEKQKNTNIVDKNKSNEELLSLSLLKEKAEKEGMFQELIEMKEQNSLLRVFASSGITIAAFAHELRNLEIKLGENRFKAITNILENYISSSSFVKEDSKNPYYRLELIAQEDIKMKSWLQYSLRTIRRDRRTIKLIDFVEYLKELRTNWLVTLRERKIELNIISNIESYRLKVFEIDLDCIFNNLIINSCEAFNQKNADYESKVINIELNKLDDRFKIIYSDKGPGLNKDIENREDIFKLNFSTKRDKHGKQIGTGLGMWLVKKSLDAYDAEINIIDNCSGFAVEMDFPSLN